MNLEMFHNPIGAFRRKAVYKNEEGINTTIKHGYGMFPAYRLR